MRHLGPEEHGLARLEAPDGATPLDHWATCGTPDQALVQRNVGDLIAQESTPGPDLSFLDQETRDRLSKLVGQLDERAADIIRSRYGLVDGRQHKLADIGVKHGISAERVRQLEREALQKLRRLGDPDLASGSAA